MQNKDILWLKFSFESNLPSALSLESQKQLMIDFNEIDSNSLIHKAFIKLGIITGLEPKAVQIIENQPYFNWTWLVSKITKNCIKIEKTEAGYQYHSTKNIFKIAKLFFYFIKVTNLAEKIIETYESQSNITLNQQSRIDSITLALCMLILTLSLPKHDEQLLSDWLKNPSTAPHSILLISKILHLRTKISKAWDGYYKSDSNANEKQPVLPEYFWNNDFKVNTVNKIKFVSIVDTEGLFNIQYVDSSKSFHELNQTVSHPRAFVFKYATPEAVNYYQEADAIVFLNGGAFAHACVVAREMNKPCIIYHANENDLKNVKTIEISSSNKMVKLTK